MALETFPKEKWGLIKFLQEELPSKYTIANDGRVMFNAIEDLKRLLNKVADLDKL